MVPILMLVSFAAGVVVGVMLFIATHDIDD